MAGVRPKVVVTGASGVVGQAILERLDGCELTCLVGRGSLARPVDGAVVLASDVSAQRLGLAPETYQRLAHGTDVVVHSAATTEWGLPAERYRRVNVDGSRRVAELATEADASVVLLSTAFVPAVDSASATGVGADNLIRPYLESKRAADEIFVEHGQPLTIIHPTNLVGDSRTGASARKQVVHHMAEWIVRGRLPCFPAHPQNVVDILPVDIVAAVVAGCIKREVFGERYWLTAGPRALTVDRAIEICVEIGRARGHPAGPVEVVDPATISERLDDVPAAVATVVRVLADVSDVVAACGGVLRSSLERIEETFDMPALDLEGALRRSLEYWSQGAGR